MVKQPALFYEDDLDKAAKERIIPDPGLPPATEADVTPTGAFKPTGVFTSTRAFTSTGPTTGLADTGLPQVRPHSHGTQVPDHYLTSTPYNSIGKIFWVSSESTYSATAFYIGNNTVVSAAHNVWNPTEEVQRIVSKKPPTFVPAMIDSGDTVGRNYGYFILDDVVYIHEKYRGENIEAFARSKCYDICIAKIIAGRGVQFPSDYLHLSNRALHARTVWHVIGYSDINGKMTEFLGYQPGGGSPQTYIIISPAASIGMSGGPWIPIDSLECNVGGIQSSAFENYSFSPTTGEIVRVVQSYFSHIWGR